MLVAKTLCDTANLNFNLIWLKFKIVDFLYVFIFIQGHIKFYNVVLG
jgi:hypothetical protein